MEAIAKTFTLLWKTKKGFEIRDMGDHMVLGDSLLVIRVARIEDDERSEGGDLKGDNKGMELVLGRNGDDDME
nr:hypothetical protein CFP56_60940 [Quercus suber]